MGAGLSLVDAVGGDDQLAAIVQRHGVARAEEDVRLAPVTREHEMLPQHTIVPRGQVAHLECVGEIQLALIERLPHVDDHLIVGLQHRVPVLEQVLDVSPDPEPLAREPQCVDAESHRRFPSVCERRAGGAARALRQLPSMSSKYARRCASGDQRSR